MATLLDAQEWERANGEFLAASVAWIRALLRRAASDRADESGRADGTTAGRPREDVDFRRGRSTVLGGSASMDPASAPVPAPPLPPPPPSPAPEPPRRGFCRRRRPEPSPVGAAEPLPVGAAEPPEPPEPPEKTPGDEVVEAAAAVATAAEITPPPALVSLAARLELSRFERDVLLLCVAAELDASVGALCAAAQSAERMGYPTFALAFAILPDPAWAAVSPERGLRYWRLVEIHQPAGHTLMASRLRADERIVNHVKGLDHLDDRLAPLLAPLGPTPGTVLPRSQQAVADEVWRPGGPMIAQLTGPAAASKALIARSVAAAFGLALYRLPAELLPTEPAELENLARLWRREAALTPVALYLDADDTADDPAAPGAGAVGRFLARLDTPAFLATRESRPDVAVATSLHDAAAPTPAERAEAWRAALGAHADATLAAALADAGRVKAGLVEAGLADAGLVDRLATQFALDVPAIEELAARNPPDRLWSACLARSRPRLDGLAGRTVPAAGWSDLVLPDEELRLLRTVADQVRHRARVHDDWGFAAGVTRGLGLSVLFTGPSGTGKTLAAEVLAGELELDLYRTDLSGVISKYIGETEKNLRRLFDAAEEGGAVLFIDEADALLGKRSEVRDAHDRYANVQVDYLLQRMESYRGLAIMATNMRSALDTAFLRRLRFIVPFPSPDKDLRRAIWERAFPPAVPGRATLDHGRLATLPVTGGMIRTIALNAAFAAAAAGSPITMPLVLTAARDEMRKLQQPIRERDYVWTGS